MMAIIYAVYTLAISAILVKQRFIGMAFIILGIILSAWLFWYHVDDVIDIRL